MYIFLCEDSIDGIFTGIYDAWASKYGHKNIQLCINDTITYELFSEYIMVSPDSEKSEKVGRTIIARLGMEVYQDILQAILAHDDKKRKSSRTKPTAFTVHSYMDFLYRMVIGFYRLWAILILQESLS